MRTLDDAIKYAEEVAEGQEESAKMWRGYPEHKYDNHLTKKAYDNCKKCAEEYRQLAEWLKELKAVRDSQMTASAQRDRLIENVRRITNLYTEQSREFGKMIEDIKKEIAEEKECAYADFERYKIEYLGVDEETVTDELPDDDFRYGMERCLEIINKHMSGKEQR